MLKAQQKLKKADEFIQNSDESEDGDDSDYEYIGGDTALYDSALDGADELLYVKDSLERINNMNDNG